MILGNGIFNQDSHVFLTKLKVFDPQKIIYQSFQQIPPKKFKKWQNGHGAMIHILVPP